MALYDSTQFSSKKKLGTRDAAQLFEHLSSMHRAPGLISSTAQTGAYLQTQPLKAEGQKKFKATIGWETSLWPAQDM